jgi:hypothetical protein
VIIYELSESAKKWASRRHQGLSPTKLRELLIKQQGRCALSEVPLLFDKEEGTPKRGGHGVHPLYPAVDHIESGSEVREHQIVCYALNDVKGHLPHACFEALKQTEPWKELMQKWRSQAEGGSRNREAFTMLIFPHGNQRKDKKSAKRARREGRQ